jgi:uncharacterized protein
MPTILASSIVDRQPFVPLLFDQLYPEGPPREWEEVAWHGFYPHLSSPELMHPDSNRYYPLRRLLDEARARLAIQDLSRFADLLRACAATIGIPLNIAHLARRAGVTPNTAKAWLQLLQHLQAIHLLPAWRGKTRRRLVRSPTLYFTDTAMACHLLEIRTPAAISASQHADAVFKNLVMAEAIKRLRQSNRLSSASFYQDSNTNRIDLIIQSADGLSACQIFPHTAISRQFLRDLTYVKRDLGAWRQQRIIYAGTASALHKETGAQLHDWREIGAVFRTWLLRTAAF